MKEALLDHAEKVVQDKGLAAISFQQLADAVGLSKASVFHHFPNSEALALGLIERCRSKYGEEYSLIRDTDHTASDKLRQIAASFDNGLRNHRLCLLGALGSSQTTLSRKLQKELRATAQAAVQTISAIFEQGREERSLSFKGTATDAAQTFLALLQGLQHLARYSDDVKIFNTSVESYIKTIEC
ncbi:MAG: TetR/AcrR family transcriptional regulator [Verrucomicrobiota bacterium]